METETKELDLLQGKYKAAVEEWVSAIRHEEALASGNHTVAEIDKWEAAHFAEDEIRSRVKAAKSEYEDGLQKSCSISRLISKRGLPTAPVRVLP